MSKKGGMQTGGAFNEGCINGVGVCANAPPFSPPQMHPPNLPYLQACAELAERVVKLKV